MANGFPGTYKSCIQTLNFQKMTKLAEQTGVQQPIKNITNETTQTNCLYPDA